MCSCLLQTFRLADCTCLALLWQRQQIDPKGEGSGWTSEINRIFLTNKTQEGRGEIDVFNLWILKYNIFFEKWNAVSISLNQYQYQFVWTELVSVFEWHADVNPSDLTREGYKWVVGDVIDYVHAFNQSKSGQEGQLKTTATDVHIQSLVISIE